MPIKTDRRDAEGIVRLLQMGWFRPVHCKSVSAQGVRALLTARKSIQQAAINLELSLPLHRMWRDEPDFRFTRQVPVTTAAA